MSRIRRALIATVWIVSLIAVAAFARAQTGPTPLPLPSPLVLTGTDIGFRVTGIAGDRPVGYVVIRVKGEWVVPKIGEGDGVIRPDPR